VRRVYVVPPPKGPERWLRLAGFLCAAAVLVSLQVGGVLYVWIARDLPRINRLADYRPGVVTVVYDRDGGVIGEFKYENQTRYLVPLDRVPQRLIDAVVSAEDKNFWSHSGVDPTSLVRAAWSDLRSKSMSQGGSTITQQLTRALLLTPEKTVRRKLREMLLAHRIESNFSKKDILYLYLNEIYFGSGAYGVQAAARLYFGKDATDLTLAECALLAGLPQAPSRYSPRNNPDEALRRRRYVLDRMAEDGRATADEARAAMDEPIRLVPLRDVNLEGAPYATEYIRLYVMAKYGEDKVLKDGLKIHTTIDPAKQRDAARAVDVGLRELDKRQGWRGPMLHLSADGIAAHVQALQKRDAARDAQVGDVVEGVVTAVNESGRSVAVATGRFAGTIALADMRWAERTQVGGGLRYLNLTNPRQIVQTGDVIQARVVALPAAGKDARLALDQKPLVQGALVSIDPRSWEILALVGGDDFRDSQFNRALQSKRQPGSSFKPIVYATALDHGFTPASVIVDTALVFDDGWSPKNATGSFQGRMRLRQALARSINTVTVRLVSEIGTTAVHEYAARLGLDLGAADDMSIALGSHEVSPIGLASAYTVFASGGLRARPILITRIEDREGHVLEKHALRRVYPAHPLTPEPAVPDPAAPGPSAAADEAELLAAKPAAPAAPTEPEDAIAGPEDLAAPDVDPATGDVLVRRVISRASAYVITSMLQSVVTSGTGARALALGKQAAGKTGTTNENVDAWFLGFTPTLLAGVWVGYDDGAKSLGGRETGAQAALPLWLEYMKRATEGHADEGFPVPPGVVYAKIDPATGLLAPPEFVGAISECFKAGTVPTEFTTGAGDIKPEDFLRYDQDSPEGRDVPVSPARLP
jgi:penicillin-binding protein 1A